jgi:hypothetical protein
MKKFLIIAIGIGSVLLFGFLGSEWNRKQQNSLTKNSAKNNPTSSSSMYSGVLLRNNPGMKSGVWYLLRDEVGKAAVESELKFSDKSDCSVGNVKIECKRIDFPNGTRVRVSGFKNNQIIDVLELVSETAGDLIKVDKLTAGDSVESPISITGKARGSWFFEASFPVHLIDRSGNLLTSTIATALSDWMTGEFVPFSAELKYDVATKTPVELVLAADNPSGLPQNDREIKIPLILIPSKLTRSVQLFYYNQGQDTDINGVVLCSDKGLVSVVREVANTENIIVDTVRLLLEGKINSEEKAKGVSSEFPLLGLKLDNIRVDKGIATVSLTDLKNKTTGGSCRVSILWKQIEKTVLQFPGIKEVKFYPETLFQP